jgi:tetratricopeptide (TPR) repeat protein
MNLGKMDEAISDFTKAININPDVKGLFVNLGAAWHYKGAYEKAVMNYDKAIAENPSRALTYYNRGVSKMLLNNLHGAISDFEKALTLDPGLDVPVYARQDAQKKLAALKGATYAVQTGAFHVKAYAEYNQNLILEKGFEARIIIFNDSDKKRWFLVRCGKSLSREDAEQLKTELKDLHGIDSFVRPEHSL